MQPALAAYILANISLLKKRDFLLEIFTECDRLPNATSVDVLSKLYVGKLMLDEDGTFVSLKRFTHTAGGGQNFTYTIDEVAPTGIKPEKGKALTVVTDPLTLPPGIVVNSGDKPISTTIGLVLLNQLVLAEPFGTTFPYINETWKPQAIEQGLFEAAVAKTITAEQLDRYVRNNFFLGHMTEIAVPNYTEKSLMTDPRVAKRRQELVEQNKEALERGDAVVMAKIEAELIQMDKDWLKGDPSMDFYGKSTSKSFDIQRKKTLVTMGMMKSFGDTGQFNFMADPLSEGISIENFPLIANEIRAASFSRAMETVDGGVAAKVLARALQNAAIVEDDCKTLRTMQILLKPETARQYLNRYIVTGYSRSAEKVPVLVELTEKNLTQFIGTVVKLRSPMSCSSAGGYCMTCMGTVFSSLNQDNLTMRALALSQFFITASLKISHGTKYSALEIGDLDQYTF